MYMLPYNIDVIYVHVLHRLIIISVVTSFNYITIYYSKIKVDTWLAVCILCYVRSYESNCKIHLFNPILIVCVYVVMYVRNGTIL